MRIIGIDYGSQRIGLAVWDSDSNLSLPRNILEGLTLPDAVTKITDIADYEKADRIVVGMPFRLTGEAGGEQVAATESFVAALRLDTEIPVETEDERLSSRMAERLAIQAGRPYAPAIDAQAAALFLESYVQRHGLDKPSDASSEPPTGASEPPTDAPTESGGVPAEPTGQPETGQ